MTNGKFELLHGDHLANNEFYINKYKFKIYRRDKPIGKQTEYYIYQELPTRIYLSGMFPKGKDKFSIDIKHEGRRYYYDIEHHNSILIIT